MLAADKIFGLHVHRLLLAAKRTVAHDALAHDVSGDFNRALAGGERLEIGRGGLRCVKELQVKRTKR